MYRDRFNKGKNLENNMDKTMKQKIKNFFICLKCSLFYPNDIMLCKNEKKNK